MNAKLTYPIILVLAYIFAGCPAPLQAQESLGIVWEVPDDSSEAASQLTAFSEMGFSYLEIEQPVNKQVVSQASRFGFNILIRSSHYYYREIDLRTDKNTLTEDYLSILEQFGLFPQVAGIGLLSQSQDYQGDFETAFSPILDSLKSRSNRTFYFVSENRWFNFEQVNQPFGRLFNESDFEPDHLLYITISEQNISDFIQFFHSNWVLQAIDFHPPLADSFREYHRTGIWNLPMPDLRPQKTSQNWLVFFLLILWVALAVQLRYFPYIRPMILRYFFAHRFYVDDILHYRERAAAGGAFMMLQHAIFTGIILYVTSRILVSDYGLETFFHHFPMLSIFGESHFSFMILGTLLTAAIEFIALFWLYLPAKNLNHLSQTINLYAGVFYLDFLIATVIITLYSSGTGTNLILILAFLFLVLWFSAFNMAAYNSSRNMGSGRVIYLLLTIGLHTIVFIGMIVFILTNDYIMQTLQLATSLGL